MSGEKIEDNFFELEGRLQKLSPAFYECIPDSGNNLIW